MKEFKLRLRSEIPEATSETVAGWLDEALKDGASLAADPGGGEAFVNVTLDESKVAELANRHGSKPPVALRRLIASHVSVPAGEARKKSAGAVAAELLPGKVLPRKLEYKEADLLPLVRGLDSGMTLLYRRIYGLPELTAARTPEADRELASAMAECVNRRSPEWLLGNADLVKLTVSFVRWSFAQTDELDKQTKALREKAAKKTAENRASAVPGAPAMTPEELNAVLAESIAAGAQP